MNAKTITMLTTVSLFSYSNFCNGQELHIGSQVPDFSSSSVINHTSSRLSLSEIKKKWILLDFWSTTCPSCVASFEKIDKLQEKFDNDLQVVFINRETQAATVDFFKRKMKLKKARVPYITEDSIFKEAFPHSFSPYYVLLDSSRRVVAFPDHAYISNDPVENLVKNNSVNFGQSTIPVKIKDHQSLLSVLDSSSFFKAKAYFILTKGIAGLATYGYDDPTIKGVQNRFTLAGVPLQTIFTVTMTELLKMKFTRNAFVFESRQKDSVMAPTDPMQYAEWLKDNAYAVDIVVNPQDAPNIMQILKYDLEQYFKFSIVIEKRMVQCFVLKRLSGTKDLTTAGGKPFAGSKRVEGGYLWIMINKRFTAFSDLLRDYFDSLINTKPFVDETGITTNVDMTIDMAFFEKYQKQDISIVNAEILKYGLVIVEEEHLADVVVIKDQK